MSVDQLVCANCKQPLPATDAKTEVRMPCARCGATVRIYTETIFESARALDSVLGLVKRPSLPSAKKLRSESFVGYEYSQDRQKLVHKLRVFDRDTDEYVERVTDIETGQVIHECVEPFSNMWGTAAPRKSIDACLSQRLRRISNLLPAYLIHAIFWHRNANNYLLKAPFYLGLAHCLSIYRLTPIKWSKPT